MQHQSIKPSFYFKVADNVWGIKDVFVNIYMVKSNFSEDWFLVDAGIKTSLPKIKKMATELFGNKKPQAIVLTHGHFDHVGCLVSLVNEWKVPVYAHYLELPYLTNKSSYPPGDPTVGGGIMAALASFYPTSPINLGAHVSALTDDVLIPGFSEWHYIHTPGHSFGHISLFRESDQVMIAGDAFITTKGESALQAIFLETKQISNPPAYFTTDWVAAKESIKKILELKPKVVATGHGKPMSGSIMQEQLKSLYENFNDDFMPHQGRYVNEPAIADVNGIMYIPPAASNPYKKWIAVGVAAIVTAMVVSTLTSQIRYSKKH